MSSEQKEIRGKLKITPLEVVIKDILIWRWQSMILEEIEWWRRIYVVNPNWFV